MSATRSAAALHRPRRGRIAADGRAGEAAGPGAGSVEPLRPRCYYNQRMGRRAVWSWVACVALAAVACSDEPDTGTNTGDGAGESGSSGTSGDGAEASSSAPASEGTGAPVACGDDTCDADEYCMIPCCGPEPCTPDRPMCLSSMLFDCAAADGMVQCALDNSNACFGQLVDGTIACDTCQ